MSKPTVSNQYVPLPDADQLRELLLPAREYALSAMPEAARPPSRGSAHVLDGVATVRHLMDLDRVLDPVHDIAVLAFQRWVDGLKGFACPTFAANHALVDALMLRVDRFGLGLYDEKDGRLFRVRVSVYPAPPSVRKVSSEEAAAAGIFRVVESKEPGEPLELKAAQLQRRNMRLFPSLLVARSRGDAERVRLARGLS